MNITIYAPGDHNADEWEVWAHLSDAPPQDQHESWIIGRGASRNEALAMAVKDLEDTVDWLQQPEWYDGKEGRSSDTSGETIETDSSSEGTS